MHFRMWLLWVKFVNVEFKSHYHCFFCCLIFVVGFSPQHLMLKLLLQNLVKNGIFMHICVDDEKCWRRKKGSNDEDSSIEL